MTATSRSEPVTCRMAEGIEPPGCCQPPLAERIARVDAARARAEASYPKSCPECGSDRVFWIFDPDVRYFECGDGHRWEDAQ